MDFHLHHKKRGNFTGSIGFVMAASGSAVGLGNIWRFPYLAAKGGGGVFILVYVVLALTFGFALLTTEVSIGRLTAQSPLTAYKKIDRRFGFIGIVACLVPTIILPYYSAIGGWVVKYLYTFITLNGNAAAADGFFTGFITAKWTPILWMVIFLAATSFVVFNGVNKGIEKYSKILMPALFILIISIAIFSVTLKFSDADGTVRTGLQGLKIYLVPDFTGMTFAKFVSIVMDAMGQLFFSISVAMGIMVAYGSYAPKEVNLMNSVNQIEFFDSIVAIIAGMMVVPAVFTFMGRDAMSAGPGLMFVSLPKIFSAMGAVGNIVGIVFFVMVTFAAVTSSVSIMEAIVSSIMDAFHFSRKKSTIIVTVYAVIAGIIVCFGYNFFYFEMPLPNGSVAQILDLMDYISNNCFMPFVAISTCILIGWVAGPKTIIEEVEQGKFKFHRKMLYIITLKFVAPVMLLLLLLQSVGIFNYFVRVP